MDINIKTWLLDIQLGTRNRIIHSYDNISDEVIWTIVSRDLPKLKTQVDNLIGE
jgi:uncharacterized protein with HEPN domain